jgi:hypothetical protein
MAFKVCSSCGKLVRVVDTRCWHCKSKRFRSELVEGKAASPASPNKEATASPRGERENRMNNNKPADNKVGIIFVLVLFGSIGSCVAVNKIQDENQRSRDWKAYVAEHPNWMAESKAREERTNKMVAEAQAELATVAGLRPSVGRHVCDNQDGHYRGVVASIHEVNSAVAGPYTAYKLTNGQVAADAIVRVCTKHEQERGEAR